jgi:predicted DNA-binding protein YlxM (UPF0122 family)
LKINPLHSKGNSQQTEEEAYRMGKIFANSMSDKGLMRIWRELKKIDSQRINDSMNKWTKQLEKYYEKLAMLRGRSLTRGVR